MLFLYAETLGKIPQNCGAHKVFPNFCKYIFNNIYVNTFVYVNTFLYLCRRDGESPRP